MWFAVELYSSVRGSSDWSWTSRRWGSGWFWPVSLAGVGCRTTLWPPPSPDGGLWRSERFPATTVYFSPQSCAQEPPSRPDLEETRGWEWNISCRRLSLRLSAVIPDGRPPLPLPLVHSDFVVVQGCGEHVVRHVHQTYKWSGLNKESQHITDAEFSLNVLSEINFFCICF